MIALTAGAMSFAAPALAGEVTGAADNLRTGWYQDEPLLAPSLVTEGRFTQLFNVPLKGQIYAQPLVANGLLLVVTEDNWVYGLDPVTGKEIWPAKQFGTPVNSSEKEIECSDLEPHIGITSTPVIDTEHNVAYFVSNRYESSSPGPIAWYMHAIDLASGQERTSFPVLIHGPSQNLGGKVEFKPARELQRPALLMMNGVVYAGFGSHCDHAPYEGWIAGVSTSGQLTTMWATSTSGGSIWQSGGGLISDRPGQVIFATGNGEGLGSNPPPGDGHNPPEGRLGQSVVRVEAQSGGGLHAIDFFSPFNNEALNGEDIDLGSSAPVALPPQYFGTSKVHDPLVQDGKYGTVYLLNGDNLGGMAQGANGTDGVVQKLGPYGGVWGAATVWPGDGRYVYIPTVGVPKTSEESTNSLNFFRYEEDGSGNPRLSPPVSTVQEFSFGSGSPIVTSNSTANGSAVLWIVRCPAHACEGEEGELRAYNAVPGGGPPKPFWSAKIGAGTKFSRPLASGGHIYVGNRAGHIIAFSGPMLTPSPESPQLAATIGETATQDLTLTATGTDVEIKEVRSPTAPFSASGLPPEGTALKPGEAIKVKVSFTPTTTGSAKGELAILTKQGSETKITLSGTGEPTAQERAEQQQREREKAEREAKERSEAAARGAIVPVSVLTSPVGTAPLSVEPVPTLTKLKLRASASRLASRRRKLVVTYTLSAPATVVVVIYRRVVSHSCPKGLATCARWVATKLKVRVAAHVGGNTLAVNLGTLAAGAYRMAATPLTRSGARGVTRNLDFRTLR